MSNKKTFLSAYWVGGKHKYLTAENMKSALKLSSTALKCPSLKGNPVDIMDTHYLRSGGCNALLISGNSDRDIQKMGIWRWETFNECI